MHLKKNEITIKVFYHHYIPLFLRIMKIIMASLPFFFLATLFYTVLTPPQLYIIYGAIAGIFVILIVYSAILHFLDRLVITNSRIVHIDWHGPFSRKENEIFLSDIQEIETQEKGILSTLHLFDYGVLRIETSGADVSILFKEAQDPEGIKDFIYHLDLKPSTIEQTPPVSLFSYDRERKHQKEKDRNG